MAELHVFKATPKNDPNEKIIERLRELLRQAKEGKIQSIALAGVMFDETYVFNHVVETVYHIAPGHEHFMKSGLFGLLVRLEMEADKEVLGPPVVGPEDE